MDTACLFSPDELGAPQGQPSQAGPAVCGTPYRRPKYIPVERNQYAFFASEIDQWIPADHLLRALWALVCDLDVSAFDAAVRSRVELRGAPAWDPRILITLLIYGYAIGVGAGRALARMLEQDWALRWLTAGQAINYHTLTTFRMAHEEKLKDLFAQFLVILEQEGQLDFRTLMQDGTKVRARASRKSFHKAPWIEERIALAKQYMEELDRKSDQEAADEQLQQRQRRNLQEQVDRMGKSLEMIQARGGTKKTEASITEPEARVMKQPLTGGFAPSYNVQLVTDAKAGMIVGARVTDAPADAQQLKDTLEQVEQESGRKPGQVVVDSGYTSRENIEMAAHKEIELIAPDVEDSEKGKGNLSRTGVNKDFHRAAFVQIEDGQALQCPAGKRLELQKEYKHHKVLCKSYAACAPDCGICEFKAHCCPKQDRRVIEKPVESEAVVSFQQRMQTERAKEIYKRRSQICEFPNMYLKEQAKLRRFHVFGQKKAGIEVVWAALMFNMVQSIRLRKKRQARA